MATRKILMLHGYSQNGTVFSKRMGAIRKMCGKDIEFVFLDGPIVLQPVDEGGGAGYIVAPEPSTPNPPDAAEIPRAWWTFRADSDPGRSKAFGLDKSIALLQDVLAKDRYEGVFGFSQGAAFAAILSALLERPDFYPPFLVDGVAPHPPFKFCVAVSGFKLLDPLWFPLFDPPYTTRTLHVLGTNDVLVVPERSQSLIDVSGNKRVELHDGGHFVPSKASWRNFFRDYLRDPEGNVPSPSLVLGGAASGTNSGAVTPPPSDEVVVEAKSSPPKL